MTIRNAIIGAGFAALRASGLHRAAGSAARGRGVILTFHRVRPERPATGYAPNLALEITSEFLDLALDVVSGKVSSLCPSTRRAAGSSKAKARRSPR
jgi:hypothetical protein